MPAETSRADLLGDLEQRRNSDGGKRIRRHQRYAWNVELSVELEEPSEVGQRRRRVSVTTSDLSVGGFSFVFDRFVHVGTTVRACFDSLPNRPSVVGTVRTCTHLSGTKHRVGVQFEHAFRREHAEGSDDDGWDG